jgi:hypothetical protein
MQVSASVTKFAADARCLDRRAMADHIILHLPVVGMEVYGRLEKAVYAAAEAFTCRIMFSPP